MAMEGGLSGSCAKKWPADVGMRLHELGKQGVVRLWGGYVLPDLEDFCERWRLVNQASHRGQAAEG